MSMLKPQGEFVRTGGSLESGGGSPDRVTEGSESCWSSVDVGTAGSMPPSSPSRQPITNSSNIEPPDPPWSEVSRWIPPP